MKRLVLAEKPSVGRDIARVLGCKKETHSYIEGNDYIVTWALGHLVSLADPEQYGKEYARTTVVTFLTRMAGKGYITTPRRGRISYVHAIKSEQEYKQQLAQKEIEFWFHGSMAEFAQTLCAAAPLTHEECQKLRRLLDHVEEK